MSPNFAGALADVLDPPAHRVDYEDDYETWLRRMFPARFTAPMAEHHHDFWRWVESIEPGVRPDDAFIAAWNRGGAKSSSLEAAVVRLGALGKRRYVLYICLTQDPQAEEHVSNIESLLSSPRLAQAYPLLCMRALTKYGAAKGWSRTRLRTASGFVVDATSLDSAARGAKHEDTRPDLIVIDDIDDQEDTLRTVEKKVRKITRAILPAGSPDVAVMYGQNLVHKNSVMSRLCDRADEPADFLHNRHVSGPVPALRDMAWEYKIREDGRRIPTIVAGEPTWAGKTLETCQADMDDWGVSAFEAEAQHSVEAPPGGIYDHVEFEHADWGVHPDFVVTTVWMDPAVTDKEQSDSHGIQADALGIDGRIYSLFSWERRASSEVALELAIEKAFEFNSPIVGVETDQGGDLWAGAFERAMQSVLKKHQNIAIEVKLGKKTRPRFMPRKAGEGHGSKVHRQQLVVADYERARIVHLLGTHAVLERALKRFPKTKPLDLADARYWSWWWLREGMGQVTRMGDRRGRGRR